MASQLPAISLTIAETPGTDDQTEPIERVDAMRAFPGRSQQRRRAPPLLSLPASRPPKSLSLSDSTFCRYSPPDRRCDPCRA